jgi:hypothetical protein
MPSHGGRSCPAEADGCELLRRSQEAMLVNQPYDPLPLWAVYALAAITSLLVLEAGFWIGRRVQLRWPDQSQAGVGIMAGAALATLGFLLAFVTNIAIGIFNERRHLVIAEANAIGTTYLRAGYLPEPYGSESRQLLREYVDLRLDALEPGRTAAAIAESEGVQDELWVLAEEVARQNPVATVSIYLTSLNEVIDLHTERLSAELGYRVPSVVVFGLYLVFLMTMMLVGVYDSYSERHNRVALTVMVLILSLVFVLVVDLDRSNAGLVTTPQKALLDLQARLRSAP